MAQLDQVFHRADEVVDGHHTLIERNFHPELLIDFVAADAREIVLLRVEEEAL